jgi:hypothetical protein
LAKSEISFEIARIMMVKKYAADTPGLIAMWQEKILVTPAFVSTIPVRVMSVASPPQCSVEAYCIRSILMALINQHGRQIRPSAKPIFSC